MEDFEYEDDQNEVFTDWETAWFAALSNTHKYGSEWTSYECDGVWKIKPIVYGGWDYIYDGETIDSPQPKDLPLGDEPTGGAVIIWVFLFVVLFVAFAAWGIWEAFA